MSMCQIHANCYSGMIPGGIAEYLTIPLDFDIRHRFIGTFVWQLPRLAHSNPLLQYVASGWEASGLITIQSGESGRRSSRCRLEREGRQATALALCRRCRRAGHRTPYLRRTCAKMCRAAGGELEQIQLLLGHASVQTTER